jgi:hypothetical protein
MLGSSRVAAQLAASQEGLSSMSESVINSNEMSNVRITQYGKGEDEEEEDDDDDEVDDDDDDDDEDDEEEKEVHNLKVSVL